MSVCLTPWCIKPQSMPEFVAYYMRQVQPFSAFIFILRVEMSPLLPWWEIGHNVHIEGLFEYSLDLSIAPLSFQLGAALHKQ